MKPCRLVFASILAAGLLATLVGFEVIPAAKDESGGAFRDLPSRHTAARSPQEKAGPVAPFAIPANATLERMIGQMILVGFEGTGTDDPGVVAVRRQIEKGTVGGVMLLARNVRSRSQLRELNASITQAGREIFPLIAVDQEGGRVQRLSERNGHRQYPSAWKVANAPEFANGEQVVSLYSALASELRNQGFNVNFGPVVDLRLNPDNPVVASLGRSYGEDPGRVTDYARWFSLAHRSANILTAAKHFPGHGSSKTDTHAAFTDISTTWNKAELKPYRDLANDNMVDMVMVGHLYHPAFSDGAGLPASLSKKAIGYLRREVGFAGVVVCDDLEMGALRKHFSFEDRIVRAVAAGNDIVILANLVQPSADLGARVHAVILDAVRRGAIARARIEDAYERIIAMKQKLATQRTAKNS